MSSTLGADIIQLPLPLYEGDADECFLAAVQAEALNTARAVELYRETVARNPLHADAHVNVGRLLHQQGRLREAEAHYVAALVSRPADATATFNLAVVLEDMQRLDEAIIRYQEALALDEHLLDAHFNLGKLYERRGDTMAAIRHLKDYRRLL